MRSYLRMGWLIVLAFAGGHVAAQVPIPVVHTWGDLQNAQKLMATPCPRVMKGETPPVLGPITFQVGIQGNEASSYGGLALYFLAPTGAQGENSPEQLGLYSVEVISQEISQEPAQPFQLYSHSYYFRPVQSKTVSGSMFYAETIPFSKVGEYKIRLMRPVPLGASAGTKPKVLAQITVHVRDRPQDRWYPLWAISDSSDGAVSEQNADGKVYAIVPVSNPKGGTAVPMTPYPRSYADLPAADQPLPSLISNDETHAHVHLKMTDATLLVTFDPKIEGFFPDDNFLSRWWVNGKPVELDPTLARPGQSRALGNQGQSTKGEFTKVGFTNKVIWGFLGAIVWYTQEVHFDLHFEPDWLGVKKGNHVGVQLLFCPDRFEETGLQADEQAQLIEEQGTKPQLPPTSFSESSNRIDFVYSGDPLHPQQ